MHRLATLWKQVWHAATTQVRLQAHRHRYTGATTTHAACNAAAELTSYLLRMIGLSLLMASFKAINTCREGVHKCRKL